MQACGAPIGAKPSGVSGSMPSSPSSASRAASRTTRRRSASRGFHTKRGPASAGRGWIGPARLGVRWRRAGIEPHLEWQQASALAGATSSCGWSLVQHCTMSIILARASTCMKNIAKPCHLHSRKRWSISAPRYRSIASNSRSRVGTGSPRSSVTAGSLLPTSASATLSASTRKRAHWSSREIVCRSQAAAERRNDVVEDVDR